MSEIISARYKDEDGLVIETVTENGKVGYVSAVEGNRHYKKIQEWLEESENSVDPYVAPVAPEPETDKERVERILGISIERLGDLFKEKS